MSGIVTSQLTNVTLAEAADSTLWDDIGGGQGSTQNSDLPIEGTETRARRIDNKTEFGFSFDNTTTIDLSSAGTHVAWWLNVLQPASTTTVSLLLGGGSTPTTSPWSEWDVYTTTNPYPPTGGWQRLWVDPTRTRDAGAGTLNLASIRQFGWRVTIGDVGGNAQNAHLDRIDYVNGGGGLLIDSGTATSPATFADFIIEDEANSYGVVIDRDGVLFCLARLTIADTTATIFNDDNFVLIFADQPVVASDFMGLKIDLQNSSTSVDFSGGIIKSGGSANLGDLIATSTLGSFNVNSCTLDNLRIITLTSTTSLTDCTINNSGQITANSATISGCRITNSTASSAILWDTNVDPNGKLDDTQFVSGGTGHAIELGSNTPSTITLSGQSYSGYASTDGNTGNEAIYNNSGKSITINIVGGGQTPTIRNGSGASTTVNNNISITLTGMRDNTEVRVFESGTLTVVAGTENATDGSPDNRSFTFSDAANDSVDIRIFNVDFEPADILGFTIPTTDTSVPIQQKVDRTFENP